MRSLIPTKERELQDIRPRSPLQSLPLLLAEFLDAQGIRLLVHKPSASEREIAVSLLYYFYVIG